MRITITAEHIKKAQAAKEGLSESQWGEIASTNCPVARALQAVGFRDVNVLSTKWLPHNGSEFSLTPTVKMFISDFDEGRTVNPRTVNI